MYPFITSAFLVKSQVLHTRLTHLNCVNTLVQMTPEVPWSANVKGAYHMTITTTV